MPVNDIALPFGNGGGSSCGGNGSGGACNRPGRGVCGECDYGLVGALPDFYYPDAFMITLDFTFPKERPCTAESIPAQL